MAEYRGQQAGLKELSCVRDYASKNMSSRHVYPYDKRTHGGGQGHLSIHSGHEAPCAAESQNLAAVTVQGDRGTTSHSHVGSQEERARQRQNMLINMVRSGLLWASQGQLCRNPRFYVSRSR